MPGGLRAKESSTDNILQLAPEAVERRTVVQTFMEENIYLNESLFEHGGPEADDLIKDLQAKTKAMGYGVRSGNVRH